MNSRWLAMVACLAFTGCTAAGDYIAGSSIRQDPALHYPLALERVTIGGTTKEEIRRRFGAPTDLQTSTIHGGARESWAYAVAEPPIHPLQYLPIVGVLALPKPPQVESFSVSFSEQGLVDGISVWKVQPYDEDSTYLLATQPSRHIPPYGSMNPLVRHVIASFSDDSQ